MKPSKQLIKKWYDKLAKSGFDDIEDNLGYNNVIRHHASDFGSKDPVLVAYTQEYFYIATQYLHENIFKNKKEYRIWELHSNGATVRDIAKQLKCSTRTVQSVISYHRVGAGLRR
jgi:Mor family transcriptional regulator